MAILLANGYSSPEETDSNAEVLALLRENFSRLANHNHDGINSAVLSAIGSLSRNTQEVVSPAWGSRDASSGLFSVDISVAATGLSIDIRNFAITVFEQVSNQVWSPFYGDITVLDGNRFKLDSNVAVAPLRIIYS